MIAFLSRVAAFAACLALALSAVRILNGAWMAEEPPVEARLIVFGDSHAKRGIDPNLLPDAGSWAQRAEPLVLTRLKVRRAFESAGKLETVVLSVSPHDLSSVEDSKFIDPDFAKNMLTRLYPLGDPSDLEPLPVDRRRWATVLFHNLWVVPRRDHSSRYRGVGYLGARSRLARADVDEVLRRHYTYDEAPAGVSAVAVRSVFEIAELCARRGARLVVVSLPLHPAYLKGMPAEPRARHAAVLKRLAETGVVVVDFTTLHLGAGAYADYDHLSYGGAARVSAMLRDTLASLAGKSARGCGGGPDRELAEAPAGGGSATPGSPGDRRCGAVAAAKRGSS